MTQIETSHHSQQGACGPSGVIRLLEVTTTLTFYQ